MRGVDVQMPVLETERLRLRPWRVQDAHDYQRIISDPAVMRYLGTGAVYGAKRLVARSLARLTDLEARRQLSLMGAAWRERGFGFWAIESKADSGLVGRTGFSRLSGWPEESTDVEISWMLAREAWGKGYATEAAAAGLRCGFAELDLASVISVAPIAHERSIRVMERLGMARRGVSHWRGFDVVWYALGRADWERSRAAGGPTA